MNPAFQVRTPLQLDNSPKALKVDFIIGTPVPPPFYPYWLGSLLHQLRRPNREQTGRIALAIVLVLNIYCIRVYRYIQLVRLLEHQDLDKG